MSVAKRFKTTGIAVGVGLFLLAMFTACDDDTGSGSTSDVSRCRSASAAAARIAEGLTVDGGGSLRYAQAVRSSEFDSVWFVAAEIDGAGIEADGDVGVWATNDLSDGLIFSVNALAREFSDWGDGGRTDAAFSMANDGAEEARDCVGG